MHNTTTTHDQIMQALDSHDPDSIQALLDFHHATFGSALMMAEEGSEQDSENDADEAEQDEDGTDDGDEQDDSQDEDAPARIARLERDLAKARRDAGKARTTAKATAAQEAEQALVAKIAKALGLGDEEEVSTETLTSQVTEAQAQARAAAVELAVYRAAGKHGADADRLLDSRSFMESLKDLDPSDADFGTQVKDAIKQAVAKDNSLKVKKASGPSSADAPGGGSKSGIKPTSLNEAIAAAYSG